MNKKTYLKMSGAVIAAAAMFATSNAAWADDSPECNNGSGVSSTECGTGSATGASTNATAVGVLAGVAADDGTALGANATVAFDATNSVALGADSVATESDTVSVGNALTGVVRKITNVGVGVITETSTDAVTGGQLFAVIKGQADVDQAFVDADAALDLRVSAVERGVANANLAQEELAFFAVNNGASNLAAKATGANAVSLGVGSQADGNDSVAIGTGAVAKDGAAVAIGLGNQASGNGAVAIGDPNTATGQGAVALGFTNTATGLAAVALGSESQAVGDSAFAQGAKAKAIGFSALALGDGAVAELQVVSNPPSNPAEPNPSANIAIGLGAKAIAQTTIAIGNLAVANAEDATVVGDKSQAGFHATAIGGEVIASGRGSQAFGWQTNAKGTASTALGFRANANADGSMAVGANTLVDVAHVNSTAIGTGAKTSRADQLVLGRAAGVSGNGTPFKGTSVTIADIAASTAAQSGPTDVMTVDASGTIGRDPSIRASIASLNTLTAKHTADIATLFDLNDENRRQIGKANEGVAMGLAMETPALPADAKFGLSGGVGYYNNASAASMAATARVSEKATISAGLGVGFETGEFGARGGFQVVW